MLVESRGKLKSYELPIDPGDSNVERLDLTKFVSDSEQKRKLITKLSDFAVDTLEQRTAIKVIKLFAKDNRSFRFDENYMHTNLYHKLTDYLTQYYAPDSHKNVLFDDSSNSGNSLKSVAEQIVIKKRALLAALDTMFFKANGKKDRLTLDLRKLFIKASNEAHKELVSVKGLFSNGTVHEASAKFEMLTGSTPHFLLESDYSYSSRLQAYMPVLTKPLNWKHRYLEVLQQVFSIDERKAKSVINHLGMFRAKDINVDGFARTSSGSPYVNVEPSVIDQAVDDRMNDPEQDLIPMSTAVHEITHSLLKDRYPEFFKPSSQFDLVKPLQDIKVQVDYGSEKIQACVTQLEELICFALTIYVNPLTTVMKISSFKDEDISPNKSYALSVLMGKDFRRKYALDLPSAINDNVLEKMKAEALHIAKQNIEILDNLKSEMLK